MNSKQIKTCSATLGAGAVLAMGALAVATSNTSVAQEDPPVPGPVTTSEITTGETVTETVAPEAPETTAAVPPITTTPTPIPTGEVQ